MGKVRKDKRERRLIGEEKEEKKENRMRKE